MRRVIYDVKCRSWRLGRVHAEAVVDARAEGDVLPRVAVAASRYLEFRHESIDWPTIVSTLYPKWIYPLWIEQ